MSDHSEHSVSHHSAVGRLHEPDPPGWAEDPRLAKALPIVLAVVCGALILADLAYHKHGHYDWEEWIGFHGFYGFGSFVFLVLVATAMRRLVMRPEHYYDGLPEHPDDEHGGHGHA